MHKKELISDEKKIGKNLQKKLLKNLLQKSSLNKIPLKKKRVIRLIRQLFLFTDKWKPENQLMFGTNINALIKREQQQLDDL